MLPIWNVIVLNKRNEALELFCRIHFIYNENWFISKDAAWKSLCYWKNCEHKSQFYILSLILKQEQSL